MRYKIKYTATAIRHLQRYRKHEQKSILDNVDRQLEFEPDLPSRNRKQLNINPIGTWELRIGQFRIFYDIIMETDEDGQAVGMVKVKAVGHKEHNRLFIGDKEFRL
ncbi:MAG TPA: type II toxin-antitoxin system RelE/ParE family toxin [Chloroflexi bacterium]|nr:type II toxin-antitoxin system RelE/ParE family toxin [Chloroflexota bacterium]